MKRDPQICLLDIDRASGRLADYVGKTGFDGFLTDPLLQDGIERQLTILGETLTRVSRN